MQYSCPDFETNRLSIGKAERPVTEDGADIGARMPTPDWSIPGCTQ